MGGGGRRSESSSHDSIHEFNTWKCHTQRQSVDKLYIDRCVEYSRPDMGGGYRPALGLPPNIVSHR